MNFDYSEATIKRIVILYSELSSYFLSGLQKVAGNEQVTVIHWGTNEATPFELHHPPSVAFYHKDNFPFARLLAFVDSLKPDLLFCGGWMDKDYLRISYKFRNRCPIILAMDNIWKGTMRQYAGIVVSRLFFKRIFTHMWVSGEPQLSFAKKLGYQDNRILKGNYSGDYDFFNAQFQLQMQNKKRNFPHKFLYVGRYSAEKGIELLCEVIEELSNENRLGDWELLCVGAGPDRQQYKDGKSIKHLGFIQPKNFAPIIQLTGVFILPSLTEPWGVVVHEFAAAGFPLICSSEVGAASEFLQHETNGVLFKAGDKEELRRAILHIIQMSDNELYKMSLHSADLASRITPTGWYNTMIQLIELTERDNT